MLTSKKNSGQITFADRKSHAERTWKSLLEEASQGKVDIERLGGVMTILNILDCQEINNRAREAKDRIDHIEVDWDSTENQAIENHRNILSRILEEIRGNN